MARNTKGWFLLSCFLGMISAMPPLATDMYLPALPVFQSDFDISTSMVQLTITMTLAGMAIGQVFAGPISDMAGRRIPLLIGMAVFGIASLGCYLVENIYVFLLLRLIQGLAGSCGIVISKAIARDVSRGAELTKFFAMLMMINGLAPILAPVIGGQILNFTSWRGIFLVLAGIGIVMMCFALYSQETLPKGRRLNGIGESLGTIPKLLQDKYFMGHCLLQSLVSAGFFSYIGCSSFVFQDIYQVTPQEFSFIFGGIGLGLMISGTIPAKTAGKIKDIKLLKVSLVVPIISSVVLFALFYVKASLMLVIPLLLITIMPLSVMGASSFSMAMSRQGRQAGTASALLGFFSMILGGITMPLAGMIGNDPSLPMAAFLFCGWASAFVVFKIFVEPEHK